MGLVQLCSTRFFRKVPQISWNVKRTWEHNFEFIVSLYFNYSLYISRLKKDFKILLQQNIVQYFNSIFFWEKSNRNKLLLQHAELHLVLSERWFKDEWMRICIEYNELGMHGPKRFIPNILIYPETR